MREEQNAVAEFVRGHDLETDVQIRFLDLVSELGDCVFSLLCLCNSLNLDAKKALEGALAKYEQRFANSGTAGSGR